MKASGGATCKLDYFKIVRGRPSLNGIELSWLNIRWSTKQIFVEKEEDMNLLVELIQLRIENPF